MNERVQKIRKLKKLSQKDFGESINLSQNHISAIEKGIRNVTPRIADDICRVYNVNKTWLISGLGDIFKNTLINERFKLIRKKERISQKDFGEMLGVSRDVISNIEYGRVEPKELFVNHLCSVFNINKDWLVNGTGEMYTIPEEDKKLSKILFDLSKENPKLYTLISKLNELDDDYIDIIFSLVESLLNKQKKQAN
ncbi:helix-turn-helix domain-containing protein [Clostridium baratii]